MIGGEPGAPVLEKVIARLGPKRAEIRERGDHHIALGAVVEAHVARPTKRRPDLATPHVADPGDIVLIPGQSRSPEKSPGSPGECPGVAARAARGLPIGGRVADQGYVRSDTLWLGSARSGSETSNAGSPRRRLGTLECAGTGQRATLRWNFRPAGTHPRRRDILEGLDRPTGGPEDPASCDLAPLRLNLDSTGNPIR